MTVRELLNLHDLAAYADAFDARRVGMSDLVSLSEDDLRDELGMESFQDRKRFKAAVASLAAGGSTPAPLSGATRFEPPTPAPLSGATRFEPSARPTPSLSGATRIEPAAALPQQLGSYRVLGLLGTGGMGTVVRARHVEEGWAQQQGGDVAIKLIHPQIATDPEFRSRFMSEAALGRKVQHPGFVPTFDVISEGAWLGTVMSFVTGDSLGSKVVPGGLSVDAVIALLAPIGEALDYLHGLGIVHRDLKPANIVVQPNGRPVVLDLGIAKDMQSGGNHTRTMTTMGTSAWMAPEQADAKHVDGAADRYAFGMIAYVLLSGQMPWSESTSEARVFSNKLMGQLVPLEQVCAGVPQHVAAAVMKMVSLEAGDRYSTCVGFVQALRVDEGGARAAALKVRADAETAAKLQTLTAKALAEAALFKAKRDAEAPTKTLPEAQAAAEQPHGASGRPPLSKGLRWGAGTFLALGFVGLGFVGLIVTGGLAPNPASIKFDGYATVNVYSLDPVPLNKATVLDAEGKAIEPQPTGLSWSVTPATVAVWAGGGMLQPVSYGEATVTARIGDVRASYRVIVALPDMTVAGYQTGRCVPPATSQLLTAQVTTEGGDLVEGMTVDWQSSDNGIGTVDAEGRFTAVADGVTTITARAGRLRAIVDVMVCYR